MGVDESRGECYNEVLTLVGIFVTMYTIKRIYCVCSHVGETEILKLY